MTVQQRILEAQLVEKVKKNPRLAEQMGITIEYPKDLDNRIIKKDENLLVHDK